MNKKQVIRINENQLKQIVMESVKRVLSENEDLDITPKGYEMRSDYRKYGKFASDYGKDAKTFVQQGKYYPDWFATGTFDDYPEDDLESFNKAELNRSISADKRWNKSADSRPLHRKGCANRELMDMDN